MKKWANENVGKTFINKAGMKAKFISSSDGPRVTLEFADGNRGGFGIDSLYDVGWKLYEEKKIKLKERQKPNYCSSL